MAKNAMKAPTTSRLDAEDYTLLALWGCACAEHVRQQRVSALLQRKRQEGLTSTGADHNARRHAAGWRVRGGSARKQRPCGTIPRMPILIDGHNLIGQLPGMSLADPDDEAKLVLLLRRYAARRRGRKVIVVFDGGVYGHPDNLNGYGVETHFARAPGNADAELIRRIRAVRRRDEWLVVSSDRAVTGEAQAHGITALSAQAFARRLAAMDQPPATLRDKRTDRPLSKAEIEEWMRVFGVQEDDDEEFS